MTTIDNTKPSVNVVTDVVLITPQMAKTCLLKNNKNNRKLNEIRVLTYANLMKAGLWKLTHQGIAFDYNGELIDGQTRLNAIVRANVSVRMMVSKGFPPEHIIVMDTNQPKSP